MSDYQAPMRDVAFSAFEVNKYDQHYKKYGKALVDDPEMVKPIIEEAAKFAERVLAPINASGDQEGVRFENGKVTLPSGFKEAHDKFLEGGWPSMLFDEQYGGQNLPSSINTIIGEFYQSANSAWCMTRLGSGVANTLINVGSEELKAKYLPKLVHGEWLGTMCLTESNTGTDLGLMRTKAEPQQDGSYKITGTKIFISSGDHNLTDNIIHMVLARLPDAPEGMKGISLFLVPKMHVNDDGSLGKQNRVSCGSIEHKMGLNASATCVMNFDGATGYLVGPPNKGLLGMFIMINQSRLGVGGQGVGQIEASYQTALRYARDRIQGRALLGPVNPDQPADPLLVHHDVRRMLLTQKAFAEGGRVFLHQCGQYLDMAHSDDPAVKDHAENMMALLTPIAKACLSEWGFEGADYGIQILGGHGYITESGVEQRVRDVRVTRIYEGANGIQGLDLLGRKVLGKQRATLQNFIQEMITFADDHAAITELQGILAKLKDHAQSWLDLTHHIDARLSDSFEIVGTAALDYLMYSGYVTMAYMWAKSGVVAAKALQQGTDEQAFYRSKLTTCKFYYDRLLPRAKTHWEIIHNDDATLKASDDDTFGLAV
jgi:alkylation response protein AidB-like acyl-CoA dehydrogenase